MTTTPSTASQAPAAQQESIDTPEFREKLQAHLLQLQRTMGLQGDKRADLIAHIDAKLAQEREEGRLDGYNKGWADASLTLIKAEARATAAEAKLAALSMEVETLMNDAVFFMGAIELHALDGVAWGERAKELLHPPKADESGLPG